jgi:hypothetical protein
MFGFDLKSRFDSATIHESCVLVSSKSGQFQTMCVGQPQSQVEFRRSAPGNSHSTRGFRCGYAVRLLLAFGFVLAAMALGPVESRADFIGDAGLSQPLSARSAAFSDAGGLLNLLSAQAGSGSSTDVQDSAPVAPSRQKDDQSPGPSALAGNLAGGCGSTSGSAPAGGFVSALGIVNDIAVPVAETCSGRITVYAPLSLPSPLAARLLDPPRLAA